MTDKELKRLGKGDLIDIIYKMKKTETELRDEIDSLKLQLDDRTIRINKAGSLAEAAASVNGLMEAAQKTAEDYIKQIKLSYAEIDQRCRLKEQETENRCRQREQQTDIIIEQKWNAFEEKLRNYSYLKDEFSAFFSNTDN